MSIAIIGSGVAGLAAAHGLRKVGVASTIYEAHSYWGGHAHSEQVDGFWFDEGPHLSFTADENVRKIFSQGLPNGAHELTARIGCYYDGQWIQYPPQVHLYGLNSTFVTNCISDYIDAGQRTSQVTNYADWLIAAYGRTIADSFPLPYTRKYWTIEASRMSVDWIRERMYVPTRQEVLLGALSQSHDGDFHYLKSYRYPLLGGFQGFLNALAEGAQIEFAKSVEKIDVKEKILHFRNGSSCFYDTLISTMPLDQLVHCIEGIKVPAAVTDAARSLLCTSVALIDLGIRRELPNQFDWFYVYDEMVSFSRVSFPYRLAPSMAPDGRGSIQAEVYFSRERPLDTPPEDLVRRVVNELIKIEVLHETSDVVSSRVRIVPYANVVYDHDRSSALAVIKPFVQECGIQLAGRYGEWEYYWTDGAARAGWRAGAAVAGLDVCDMISAPI
jgi:protoporphyrinogen oxidase